eukprot:CAMPEP_0205936706 /NCGR_PEP_ID=MMETSP1325-20131115/42243_1 /ASSEMBLY_ACC=CAM_ASM_000708 /TAXON_ID=236786 /ORGANISM="Florenciella sp., Strain RCC1007" /LENGTH=118 /DNA_ID=CAMNT_0053306895 /DNA_START=60 /DNA_END=413 /DNA_ORIENTATION=-
MLSVLDTKGLLPFLRAPEVYIGATLEDSLWDIYEYFASSGNRQISGSRAFLSNRSWAKMLRELDLIADGSELTLSTHPDVIFRRYSLKGRLWFSDCIRALRELDLWMGGSDAEPLARV